MALDDWFGLRSWRPVSVTIAAPGVFTSEAHGMSKNDKVFLQTTGALPTGLATDTAYFVITGTYSDGSTDPDTFQLTSSKNGTAITTTGSQSGQHYFSNSYRRLIPSNDSNQ